MAKLGKMLKNQRGQIGQILVVLVLIMVAVLGIMRYVMPMFNQTEGVVDPASQQLADLSADALRTAIGTEGDEVTGQTVINTWNKYYKDADVTVAYQNTSGTLISYVGGATGQTYGEYEAATITSETNKINKIGKYRISEIQQYDSGKLRSIRFNQIN